MNPLPFKPWRLCATVVATLFSAGVQASPAHGLEIGGFGRLVETSEVEAFLDRGRYFSYQGKQRQPVGDWYQRTSRYYLLGDNKALLAVGVGKESATHDYFKPGTQLVRIHETGVPLSTSLSAFTTLGWPQSNPDLRIFPEIDAVLSAATGELRTVSVSPYGAAGLLLVAPDMSRVVSRTADGAVVLMEPGKGLVGVIWPDPKALAEAREQVSREQRRLSETGRYQHGTERGLFEPYARYKWAHDQFTWYRKDGQWHLRGLGQTTEPEPLSTPFAQFLRDYYAHLVKTGTPLAWRNFRAGHPGIRVLPHDDPRLRPPCDCGLLYYPGNPLPLAFALEHPQPMLGVKVEAFGLSGDKLRPRLYTRMARDAALSAITRHFATQGLRMLRINESHYSIRGGTVTLFLRVYDTADPEVVAIDLANHGAANCLECLK
ncbi:hypothetical protein [Pseudomonas sp.]|uniref:hypothetical protein n=1 Tax=Pseudomonas sp. TaxID=306 RepID=UPI003D0D36B0